MNVATPLSAEVLASWLLPMPPVLPLSPTRSDYDFDPASRPQGLQELLPAAVLFPIVARAEPTVLFTQRSEGLSRHPGQVCFPGGRTDPEDGSLVATALRELREETGIAEDFVSVAGFLDVYETGTGYAILPVVGMLREGFALAPDSREVTGVFEVPLAFLLDPANRQERTAEWKGRLRRFYAFQYETHYIWGATASILVNLAERFHDAP
jgi:8-oxo-dGTP pyrophosphatase MutT (NUDIX family)